MKQWKRKHCTEQFSAVNPPTLSSAMTMQILFCFINYIWLHWWWGYYNFTKTTRLQNFSTKKWNIYIKILRIVIVIHWNAPYTAQVEVRVDRKYRLTVGEKKWVTFQEESHLCQFSLQLLWPVERRLMGQQRKEEASGQARKDTARVIKKNKGKIYNLKMMRWEN